MIEAMVHAVAEGILDILLVLGFVYSVVAVVGWLIVLYWRRKEWE